MAFRTAGPVANVNPSFVGGGYAFFVSTVNQPNGGANTANQVTLNTQIVGSNDITNTSGTITFTKAGVYQLIIELFFTSTTGANPTITSWVAQNNTNIPNSAQDFQLLGGANTVQCSTCTWQVSAALNDTLKFYWSSSNNAVTLAAQGPQTNPTRPASPSAIVSIHQVA